MKTCEVNEKLIGKRVRGIAFGILVTGVVTSVQVDCNSAVVCFKYDQPINWGGEYYTKGENWARLADEYGSLHWMEVIDK